MTVHELEDATSLLASAPDLRARLAADGYVFLRGLVAADVVRSVVEEMLAVVSPLGWTAPGARIAPEADERWWTGYVRLQALQSFHELAHHPALTAACASLCGEPLLVHPRKIARMTSPGSAFATPAHQDLPLIEGSPATVTAWLPLTPCGPDDGALQVAVGSHGAGLRRVRPSAGGGAMSVGDDIAAATWASADFEPGDVLVLHALNVHRAAANRGAGMRVSVDYRYQAASEPVCSRSLLPHAHGIVPAWERLTDGWTSDRSVRPPDSCVIIEPPPPLLPSW
jgi:hypothetical protein